MAGLLAFAAIVIGAGRSGATRAHLDAGATMEVHAVGAPRANGTVYTVVTHQAAVRESVGAAAQTNEPSVTITATAGGGGENTSKSRVQVSERAVKPCTTTKNVPSATVAGDGLGGPGHETCRN